MIAINLREKEAICKKYPNTQFVRTMKQDSKRHHYFMVEAGAPLRYLNTLRGLDEPKVCKKGSEHYKRQNKLSGNTRHRYW